MPLSVGQRLVVGARLDGRGVVAVRVGQRSEEDKCERRHCERAMENRGLGSRSWEEVKFMAGGQAGHEGSKRAWTREAAAILRRLVRRLVQRHPGRPTTTGEMVRAGGAGATVECKHAF